MDDDEASADGVFGVVASAVEGDVLGEVFVGEVEGVFVSLDGPVEEVVEVGPVGACGVVGVVEADVFSDLGEAFVEFGDGAGEGHVDVGVVRLCFAWGCGLAGGGGPASGLGVCVGCGVSGGGEGFLAAFVVPWRACLPGAAHVFRVVVWVVSLGWLVLSRLCF